MSFPQTGDAPFLAPKWLPSNRDRTRNDGHGQIPYLQMVHTIGAVARTRGVVPR